MTQLKKKGSRVEVFCSVTIKSFDRFTRIHSSIYLQLETFLSRHDDGVITDSQKQTLLTTVDKNIDWVTKNRGPISDWLKTV